MSVPESIKALARQLPVPKNDFLGVSGQLPGLPFQVLMFSRCPRTDVRPDFHYRFLWVICLDGAGDVVIDGKPHRLTPGQSVLVRPYARHGYEQIPGEAPLECLFIGFEMESAGSISQLDGVIQDWDARAWETQQMMLSHFLRLGNDNHHGQAQYTADRSEVVLQLARLLEGAIAPLQANQGGTGDERTTEAQHIVERLWLYARNASPPPTEQDDGTYAVPSGVSAASITRGMLAKELAVSESSLRDAVRTFAHTSPRDFVRRIRLQRAGMWLMEYGISVQDVAKNAGYAEAAAFSNEFKKLMGIRPSALLKDFARDQEQKSPSRRLHFQPEFTVKRNT